MAHINDNKTPELCGRCRIEIHPSETGIRHFGTYRAHSENRCMDLMRARLERLESDFGACRTLRDQFAMAVLNGMLSGSPQNQTETYQVYGVEYWLVSPLATAVSAYALADAMMEARKPKPFGDLG